MAHVALQPTVIALPTERKFFHQPKPGGVEVDQGDDLALFGDAQGGRWFILSALHGLFGSSVRRFAQDKNRRPARFYRIVNEIPTVIMIIIVVLAVVKPF